MPPLNTQTAKEIWNGTNGFPSPQSKGVLDTPWNGLYFHQKEEIYRILNAAYQLGVGFGMESVRTTVE